MTSKQKGIFFIILSAFFFALMNSFVKLAGDVPPIQKAFFRNFGALIIASCVILKKGGGIRPKTGSFPLLISRSIFGTMGIICNFYALSHLGLSDASSLSKLAPFFVVLFSFLFLKEALKLYHIAGISLAFIASLLIVKPIGFSTSNYSFYALIATFGAMSAGAAYTSIRALSKKNESPPLIVFFFSIISCLIMLPLIIYFYKPMSSIQILYLTLASISGALAQFSVTTAYIKAPGKEISIYDYSQVIFASFMGYILYSDIPDIYSLLGYILIFLASFYIYFRGARSL